MKKPILIGEDYFEKIVGGSYFHVNKTLFIKELLENRGEVSLITRPRRFGKMHNMSMLRYFFDVTMDSKALFDGLNVMEHKDIVEKHLNKYPVIFLSLKNVEGKSFESSINNPKVCGIMNKFFVTCFGFTEEEVKDTCELYGLNDKFDEVKKWYDGYRFGGQDMYNPWSIIKYLDEKEIDNYWVNTGSVRVLQDVFYKGDSALKNELAAFIFDCFGFVGAGYFFIKAD